MATQTIKLDDNPIFQSGYTYLQVAGSDGSDQTPAGYHLKWDFLKKLGESHLPKGDYTEDEPYETSIGFNRSDDFVRIYRAKFTDRAFSIDFNTAAEPEINLVNGKWNWTYEIPVSNVEGRYLTVRLIFTNTDNYDALATLIPTTSNWQNFIAGYDGVMELYVENSEEESRLTFYHEFVATQPSSSHPFLLRVEAVGTPDSSDPDTMQINARKKYTSPSGTKIIHSENTKFLRFDNINAKITHIYLTTYEEFIIGRNRSEGWDKIGSFALTLSDDRMKERFLASHIDGDSGNWPKFNGTDSSGAFRVKKENYFERWRREGYSFSSTSPDANDTLGLQNFIHEYMVRSTTDVKAMVDLNSDIEGDVSTQTISCLDMLRLVSLDYHVSRIMGMGHIDLTSDSYQYIYCLEYATTAALEEGDEAITRTHLYLSLPTTNTTYRLPKAPVLDNCTFGVEIANGTDTPAAITDEDGYAPQEQLRFININRKPYNHEYAFGPFFNRPEEFDLSKESQPVAYGIEYKELNETEYRKPEISHDEDYKDNAGIFETVPIMENGTPRIFTHQEDENGTHVYAAYAINWFSRVSPLSNTKEVETHFPSYARLLPPFNYASQLIQDEDPSEVEIEDKTLLLTTVAEQERLAAFGEDDDKTLVRTTFDWNHVHNHAHPTVDYAEFFFREDEPSVVKGKVTGVTWDGSDTAIVTTGSYSGHSSFPGSSVQPSVTTLEAGKYIGSYFSTGSTHFVIEGFATYGNNPSIRVRVLKQNQASAPDPSNQNQFLSQETVQLPQQGDLFFIIENMGEPANWDLKHKERIYIEKNYFNESIGLRYSPTNIVYYPVKSVFYSYGDNKTNFNLAKELKTNSTTGVTLEYVVRPRIVAINSNSVSISGNWVNEVDMNATFRIFGNEFNDGAYSISGVTYSGTTDTTKITIPGVFPNGTLADGVVHLLVSLPLVGASLVSNRVIVADDKVDQFNLATISYVTESDNTETRFVVGGFNYDVTFEPLLDDLGNGTGYIQVFANGELLPHPDSRVAWHKGTVRLTDLTGKMQSYPVSYIGNLTSTSHSGLALVVQDPGFIPLNENDPDPADSYTFDLNEGQAVNFHPSYKLYLKASEGVNPVTGAAIPVGGVHFDEEGILVESSDPLVLSRQTFMSVRSVDVINGLKSFLSSPVVLFAQKISPPVAPAQPQGPVYATRPNYYGKSSYTFDTKVDTSNGRTPYSMVFYRASDDAILDMLYLPGTVEAIKTTLSGYPQSFVNDPQLWDILINAIPDPVNTDQFKTLTTTDGEFTWPVPDNSNFYVEFESNLPLEDYYPVGGLCRPFEGGTLGLDEQKNVYGKFVDCTELIKLAVQNAFTPLNEQPPLYGHIKTDSRATSSAPAVIRDTNGNLLDPLTNDIYPMIRRFTDNGSTIVRFTDYSLDGASINKYFYRAMELDDKFKFSPPSGTLGPVILVNSMAPDQPQIRKVLTRLPNPNSGTTAGVVFELNQYLTRLEITKFEIYRATNADDALSVRTMQKVKVIPADEVLVDDFENDVFPLYGENLYYRLVAIREVRDMEDVMVSEATIVVDAPSKPSDVVQTSLADSINPEAPELTFELGNSTAEEYEDVEILWSATCYNGTYALQKMNSKGNWNEVYRTTVASGTMQYPPLPGQEGYSPTLELTLPREDENGNAIYHRFRVVVENSSGLFNLVQKEYTLDVSNLVQEDYGNLDLEDNSGSIII